MIEAQGEGKHLSNVICLYASVSGIDIEIMANFSSHERQKSKLCFKIPLFNQFCKNLHMLRVYILP